MQNRPPIVGQSPPRLDGMDKARGLARYTDDLQPEGCRHGFVVRSTVAHGRLKALRFDPAFDWSRVAVATARDIPGPNVLAMHDRSMPLLADDTVRYIGEPIAVIAAPTARLAREAAGWVRADIEPLPATTTLAACVERFLRGEEQPWLARQTVVKGDAEAALNDAPIVVEGVYEAGYQEQLYLEPQAMIAYPQPDGGWLFEGSLQCPYYVVNELHEALGVPASKMRVRQAAVGGAFGGKEEFPSMLAGYAAMGALACGKPVKIVYDRQQDIAFTTKRHPYWSRYRVGLERDGTIRAIVCDYLLNGGAYLTLSDVVMYRGILHAAMNYRCRHVFVDGRVAMTHTFPSGAFRGFGAPQAFWGWETHVDRMAEAAGMSPHAFRLKNALALGDTTPTGQVLRESVGSPAVLETALARADFDRTWRASSRGRAGERVWKGIGLSFFAHGAGFTGDGEARIASRVAIELDRLEDGRPGLIARVSSTEMGQGAHTALAQIVADAAACPLERVRCPLADTGFAPDSGPTVASRTTMIVGSNLHAAALSLCARLEAGAPFEEAAERLLAREGPLREERAFALPPDIHWDQSTFCGDAYPAYAWGCNIAEVEVDTLTFEIRVTRVTSCMDIGRVIHPVLAQGQVEGGLTQALGYAVMEALGIREGRFDADRLQTYIIPTTLDVPVFDVSFLEYPCDSLPPGAKGVGEIPMDGLAPAIGNALYAATGMRFHRIPIRPEDLYARWVETKGAGFP